MVTPDSKKRDQEQEECCIQDACFHHTHVYSLLFQDRSIKAKIKLIMLSVNEKRMKTYIVTDAEWTERRPMPSLYNTLSENAVLPDIVFFRSKCDPGAYLSLNGC